MKENVVSCFLHLPADAKIEKIISCPEYGEIAAILNWNGIPITFFLSKNFITPVDVVYEEARRMTECLDVQGLKSTLMYGVIYDVLGKWLLETGTLSMDEWLNRHKDKDIQQHILTRDCGGWTLEELLGDVFQLEWTQEKFGNRYVVARAGEPATDGEANYPARMRYAYDGSMGIGAKARIFFF